MKNLICILLIISLVGCATMSTIESKNRQNLNRLVVNMPKTEVLNTMGTDTITCYKSELLMLSILSLGCLLPVYLHDTQKITNPYRSEIWQSKVSGETLEIVYYYTDTKKADYAITDDELTPLVFCNHRLIGWGWGFLRDVEAKYEIRLR